MIFETTKSNSVSTSTEPLADAMESQSTKDSVLQLLFQASVAGNGSRPFSVASRENATPSFAMPSGADADFNETLPMHRPDGGVGTGEEEEEEKEHRLSLPMLFILVGVLVKMVIVLWMIKTNTIRR